MLQRSRLCSVLLVSVAVAAAHPLAAQKRPMTWTDMQELRVVTTPELSPDGEWLLYGLEAPDWRDGTNNSDIYLVSTDAGLPSARRLTTTESVREARPQWMPDGRHLVFASNPDGPSQLFLMHRDSMAQRRITAAPAGVSAFDFTPDGRWLVYRSGRSATDLQLYAVAVDAILAGGDAPPARQVTSHPTGIGNWRIAPDSRRIYYTASEAGDSLDRLRREARFTLQVQDPVAPAGGIWAADLTTGGMTPVVRDSTIAVGDFTLSADGRWLAFRALPNDRIKRNAGVESVMYGDNYLVETATGRLERLTNNEELPESAISFSPDSRWIAYAAALSPPGFTQNRRLFLRRADARGGEWRQLGAAFDDNVGADAWSPDSRTIYFDAGVGASTQLFALDVATGAVRQLTNVKGVVSVTAPRDARHPFLVMYQDPTHPAAAFAARTAGDLADQARWVPLTDANPQVRGFALGETSEITWTSRDGQKVGGVLVKPVGYQAARRYPLLVVLHGGPHAAETMTFNGDDNDGPQVYAGAGYMVLAPNYRGSSNYGERFKRAIIGNYAGRSFDDVMSGVDHLIRTGLVDSTQMGVAGHSAGGTLGNWILVNTSRFKAISTGAGVANWISMYGTSDFQRPREEWFGGPPYGNFEAYWDQSPLKYVRNARTPTLIYATEGDPRVPSGQAKELYTALRRLGVPAELHIYPGTQHGVPGARNRIAHGMAEMAWMDLHVRQSGRPFTWSNVLATLAPPASSAPAGTAAEAVSVPEAMLRRYVGQYDMGQGRTISITLEGGRLGGQPTGQSKAPLVPQNERRFFVGQAGGSTQIEFKADADGTITGLDLIQNGNVRRGTRMK